MRKELSTFAASFILVPGTAFGGTLVLNTGYNYTATTPGTMLNYGAPDPTWIKIASYEPPAGVVPVAPARVVWPGTWAVLPNAQWLAPRNSSASTIGVNATSPSCPAYSIFRKCFCLLDRANAQMTIDVRADDNVQVWLNTMLYTVIGPVAGNLNISQPPHHYSSSNVPAHSEYFRVGRNCIYVLLEDNVAWGALGFTLAGTVSAPGLMPNPATGNNGNFGRCGCPTEF